jgi:hypothetical protein
LRPRRRTNPADRTLSVVREIEQRWRESVSDLPFSDEIWRYSRRGQAGDPPQGWKIHLSATPLSAREVFSRAFPILRANDVLFKVPVRLEILTEMNSGLPQFSQVGKFLTLYPCSTAEAIALASALHAATRGLPGPEIPFDKRYRKNSLVHYRYGAFGGTRNGAMDTGVIRDPAGKAHKDKRAAGCAIPSWLSDPFQHGRAKARRPRGPIGEDYLAFKAIAQRGKGGVYEAVDLSVSPARLVILKEGRRQGEVDLLGRDGYARVKHEAHLLRLLHRAEIPVPELFAEFTQNGNRYIVIEKIPGRPLLSRRRPQPGKSSWQRAQKILDQALPLMSQIHASGWVWRDCKPSHLFMHRGKMRLIDFEGACRLDDTQAMPWSSPHYVPPIHEHSLSRQAGTREDDYALGVIAFQFATGEFPPRNGRRRASIYKASRCPDSLRSKIEGLLQVQ